jgi:hypothetical protein
MAKAKASKPCVPSQEKSVVLPSRSQCDDFFASQISDEETAYLLPQSTAGAKTTLATRGVHPLVA